MILIILLGELTSLRTQKLKLLCTTKAAEKVLLSRIFHLISMVTQRHARFHPKKATRLQWSVIDGFIQEPK